MNTYRLIDIEAMLIIELAQHATQTVARNSQSPLFREKKSSMLSWSTNIPVMENGIIRVVTRRSATAKLTIKTFCNTLSFLFNKTEQMTSILPNMPRIEVKRRLEPYTFRYAAAGGCCWLIDGDVMLSVLELDGTVNGIDDMMAVRRLLVVVKLYSETKSIVRVS